MDADAWRDERNAAGAGAAVDIGLALSAEDAAAAVLGNDLESTMAFECGVARLAQRHDGRRHHAEHLCLHDGGDLPCDCAVGLCVAQFRGGEEREMELGNLQSVTVLMAGTHKHTGHGPRMRATQLGSAQCNKGCSE